MAQKQINTPKIEGVLYTKHKDQLAKVSDVYDGVDTAINHLQQYNKESNDDYMKRQTVATLNNFVFRVVNSIKNIVFRKDINIEELKGTTVYPHLDMIDYKQSLNSFTKEVLINFEKDGKAYILIDSPIYSEDIETKADEITAGLRPYMKLINRSDIVNWQLDDQLKYKRVTLKETYYVDQEDGSFEEKVETQYRVLHRGGLVQVWRDDVVFQTIEANFDEIPLVEVGAADIPNLYDLTKINLNHMNRDSELNMYIRIAAAPIPVLYGSNNADTNLQVIGVNQGLRFSGTPSEAGFEWVEMSGSNAEIIRNQKKDDEEAMLDITINLVTSNQPRTATEVNSDNIENESRLVDSATVLEEGINKALEIFANFQGSTLEGKMVKVNKDFDSNKLTDEQVTQHRADYLAGIISWDKLIDVFTVGEIYSEMTPEEKTAEKARLVDSGEVE